jgi:GT2 family glycosyltransferase
MMNISDDSTPENKASLRKPCISIIIPTLNSKTINKTLEAISRCASVDVVKEILIIGQQESLGFPDEVKCQYIPVEESPTPPKNRNIGAELASGDWLLFVDSDCLPSTQWIETYLQAFKDQGEFYTGSVDLPDGMNYWSWCDHLLGFGDQVHGIFPGKYLSYTASINFAVTKAFYQRIGGFDESFTRAGEDLDFSFRTIQNGQKIKFINDAVVFHYHSRNSLRIAWNHLFQFGEGTVRIRMKYRNRWSMMQKVGYSVVRLRILGEIIGFMRVVARACLRPFKRPRLFLYWKYLPGVFILDLAHTQGIIYNFRVFYKN